MSDIQLNSSWKNRLQTEFNKPYMNDLKSFLEQEYKKGKTIFPRGNEYFNALNCTEFENVRVVVLGQDPYHGPGQAHGLSFSVQEGVAVPPSLQNIHKEIAADLKISNGKKGNLTAWAKQGVLLLNSVLTVEQHKAASHRGKGWEEFTDAVIQKINEERDHVVFMLWGSYAQKKGQFIDRSRHLVLEAPHPSPLSAHRGFLGCRHFSQANDYLVNNSITPIEWQL